jgi:hypothetical protein
VGFINWIGDRYKVPVPPLLKDLLDRQLGFSWCATGLLDPIYFDEFDMTTLKHLYC